MGSRLDVREMREWCYEANSLVFVDVVGAASRRQTCGCYDGGGSCGFHRGRERGW